MCVVHIVLVKVDPDDHDDDSMSSKAMTSKNAAEDKTER